MIVTFFQLDKRNFGSQIDIYLFSTNSTKLRKGKLKILDFKRFHYPTIDSEWIGIL